MKKQLLLLAVLLSCLCSYAQNYECLKFGPIYYYTNSEGYLRGIRIDSVDTVGTNIIYHPYKSARNKVIDYSVHPYIRQVDTLSGSWLGENVIQQNDGTFLFDNFWDDTVVIKTQATLGETWTMFDYYYPLKYTATITKLDTQTIEGVLDSIKVIRILSYFHDTPYHIDPVDSIELYLSKNHGFSRAIDLYMFPYRYPVYNDTICYPCTFARVDHFTDRIYHNTTGPDLGAYWLIPEPQYIIFNLTGFVNTRWTSIYNYVAGDEFGYRDYLSDYHSQFCRVVIDSFFVIDPETRQYHCTKYVEDKTIIPSIPFVINYEHFTTEFGLFADSTFVVKTNLLPEEVMNTEYYYVNKSTDSTGVCNGDTYGVYAEEFSYPYFSPAQVPYTDFGTVLAQDYSIYATNKGKIGGETVGYPNIRTYEAKFFVLSGDTCGFYSTAIENINEQPKTIVYPNPAKQFINIECHEGMNIVYLTDVTGHVLISSQFTKGKNELNIGQLPDGMYLLKINNEPAVKIIKQE